LPARSWRGTSPETAKAPSTLRKSEPDSSVDADAPPSTSSDALVLAGAGHPEIQASALWNSLMSGRPSRPGVAASPAMRRQRTSSRTIAAALFARCCMYMEIGDTQPSYVTAVKAGDRQHAKHARFLICGGNFRHNRTEPLGTTGKQIVRTGEACNSSSVGPVGDNFPISPGKTQKT
jgi:hypothetical protein